MSGEDPIERFVWEGLCASSGEKLNGTMYAQSPLQVRKQLWQKQVIAVRIRRQRVPGRWRQADDEGGLVYAVLSVLMASGIPLAESLGLLMETMRAGKMRTALSSVQFEVASGQSLALAMARHPACFPPFYTRLVQLGEDAGVLEEVMMRLSEHHDRMTHLRSRVRQALMYPMTVLSVAVLLMMIMLVFVVPQFAAVFHGMGAELPPLTRALINMSGMLEHSMMWLVCGCVLLIAALRSGWRRSPAARRWMQDSLLQLPLVGEIWRLDMTVRFCRHMVLLLEAGVPLVEALHVLAPVMGQMTVSRTVELLATKAASGMSIREAFEQGVSWPLCPLARHMMVMGERSGHLETLLMRSAHCHEKILNGKVDMLGVMLEPLLMVVLGLIMGGFIVALYLPVFNMGSIF